MSAMTGHWPQYLYAGLLVLGIVIHVSKHGQPRDPYDGPIAFISALITAWILYMGGFWG